MTLKELKTRLASIDESKDNFPVHVMQECKLSATSTRMVQLESEVTDIAVASDYVVIIGQELR